MSAVADGRSKWNDDRLDEMKEDIRALAPVAAQVAVLESEFADMRDDLRIVERITRRTHKRIGKALRELDAVRAEQKIEEKHVNRAHKWWMRSAGAIQAIAATVAGLTGIAGLVIALLSAGSGHG